MKNYRFQIILFSILAVGIFVLGGHIFTVGLDAAFAEFGDKDKPLYLRNVIIALAAIATGIFTWWKNVLNKKQIDNLQRQTENTLKQTESTLKQTENTSKQINYLQSQLTLQESIRLDSLYAKAVELLNEKNDLITRRAGVHILKDLALISKENTIKCIDMLSSLNEMWMPAFIKNHFAFFIEDDWLNENITIEHLKKFNIKSDHYNNLIEQILVSQTVVKALTETLKKLTGVSFEGFDLSYKYLCSIDFSNIDLTKFNFKNSFLCGATFNEINLNNVNFTNAFLHGARFNKSTLRKALFFATKMVCCNFYDVDLSNSKFDRAKLDLSHFNQCKLSGCSFFSANLTGVNINRTNLNGVNFGFAKLMGSKIENCTLNGGYLIYSDFESAEILNSSFVGCELSQSKFYCTQLNDVDLSLSIFDNTNFYKSKIRSTHNSIVMGNFIYIEKECVLQSKEKFDKWLLKYSYGLSYVNTWTFNFIMEDAFKRYIMEHNSSLDKHFDIINEPGLEY